MSSYAPISYEQSGQTWTKTLHNDTYPFISPEKVNHQGRYVLITGASKGVGYATAISFAKAGAAGIALCARSGFETLEKEIIAIAKSAGHKTPELLKIKLDITKYTDVEAAAAEVEQKWGKLDILINNAGYLSEFASIADGDKDEYWMNYEVNLRGVYWMTKLFVPLLLQGSEKTIIGLSSAGANVLTPGGSAYQVTKFALLRFTEFIMVDHGDQGILAYCVHPGGVKTEVALGMPDFMHVYLTDTPELAADSMVWLSAERRDWLAGRYLNCNWDMPELLERKEEIVNGDKLKQRLVV